MAKSVKLAPIWLIFCALFARGYPILLPLGVIQYPILFLFGKKRTMSAADFAEKTRACTQKSKFAHKSASVAQAKMGTNFA